MASQEEWAQPAPSPGQEGLAQDQPQAHTCSSLPPKRTELSVELGWGVASVPDSWLTLLVITRPDLSHPSGAGSGGSACSLGSGF